MDRWLGSGLILGALAFYLVVVPAQVAIPRLRVGGGEGGIAASPLFFPRVIAVALGILGVLLFLRGRSRDETARDGEGFRVVRREAVRVGGTLAILVLYVLSLPLLGYLVATPLAQAGLMAFLGFRRWGLIAALAVLTTAVVYVGFRWGMLILLPEGMFS
jgi:hypothetical protein